MEIHVCNKKKTTVIIRLIVGRGWGQGRFILKVCIVGFHIFQILGFNTCFFKDYVGLLNQSLKENGPDYNYRTQMAP